MSARVRHRRRVLVSLLQQQAWQSGECAAAVSLIKSAWETENGCC